MGKYYIWFVVIVAGLAGIIRVLLPRRFAELQLQNLGQATSISRAKVKAILFLVVGLIFGALYFFPWGRQSWVVIGTLFTLLSAAEVYFQAKFHTIEALVFQSRLLGILYLGLAACSYVMLGRA